MSNINKVLILKTNYYKLLINTLLIIVFNAYSQKNTKENIIYSAKDSVVYDLKNNKVYLYNDAEVLHDKSKLTAYYICIDFNNKILTAKGLNDTIGKYLFAPVLEENDKSYFADTIRYNYKTKKAKIDKLLTEQNGGYLHGGEIKKETEDIYFLKNGKYTTCENDEPHFFINAKKIKLISGNKIITGPANLVLNDMPTPLAIPFGIFPTENERSTGVILPTYGESFNLGYHLSDFGYHFSINEYLNLTLNGDIYSRGSWRIGTSSAYKKRYKYDGRININFAKTIIGEVELPNYSLSRDFKVNWQHKQDSKSHPYNNFSASVNLASSSYNRNNINNSDYLQNSLSSNISFQRRWENSPLNLSVNFRHNQNTLNNQVDLTLPEVALTMNRIFPFKKTIKKTWYKNLGINYSLNAKNLISSPDSLLFSNMEQSFKNGIKHSIPISTSFNLLKFLNLRSSINYTERWYFDKKYRTWDSNLQTIKIDTTNGFFAIREFNFSTQINTKLYGHFNSRNKKFRHVFTPSISYTYKPDFSDDKYGVYGSLETDNSIETYPYFQGNVYGFPSNRKQNLISVNLNNNLEMKIIDSTATRKIKLVESFNISSSYNNAVDSFKLNNISFNFRTKLFDKINLKFNGIIDPYIINGNNQRIDKLSISQGNLGRLTNLNFDVSVNLNNNSDKVSSSGKVSQSDLEYINENMDNYIDFSVPWNLQFFYNFSYRKPLSESELIQSINFNGDLNITKKWKVGFSSGYDLKSGDFTYTTIDIYRDLHCWEMSFNWVPIGFHQSYNFIIRVKSSILQDLKLSKKKSFYDY